MKIELENVKPSDIEKRSFDIISEELGNRTFDEKEALIIKRCIHTSADFEYADRLCFSDGAIDAALSAITNGCDIVSDTQMVKSGINKAILKSFGGEVHCFISDPDIGEEAKLRQCTRSAICMERAANIKAHPIIAVGNAPTALIRLYELIQNGELSPALVIGVPVGFVNVVQAKKLIMQCDVPYIVAKGRKGGSNIAACICNALLYMLRR